MRKLLLLLLLDAFRPDYLHYADYIRSLAIQGATGRLKESFGFIGQGAFFGGRQPAEWGPTNMFWFDPENSPFTIARYLAPAVKRSTPAIQAARAFIESVARQRVTAYETAYLSTAHIPLEYLHFFDTAEKFAPWDPRVGYRSLFSILDEHHLTWFQCSWPMSNTLPRRGDSGILEHALSSLCPEHRFAFVHFGDLDSLGHQYGPGSSQVREGVQKIDQYVRRLVEHCYQVYDQVDLVLFGDHGMVNVVRTLNIQEVLQSLGLRVGDDYVYFLDSTMARFWFNLRTAMFKVQEALADLEGGKILDEEAQRRLQIWGGDRRNGELYFLAEPGVLILPNFFQGDAPVKGMHGYDPECEENQGLFLLNCQSRVCRGDVGIVEATQLFHTCLDLLGLDVPEFQPACSALAQLRSRCTKGRYTLNTDPRAEETVALHLKQITNAIVSAAPDAEAVILTGGFGRGEGSVAMQDATVRPLNDYDLLVVSRQAEAGRLKSLGAILARQVGINGVDIGPISPEALKGLRLSILTYDLKYGSQVIWGDPLILEQIPRYAAADIPLSEGIQLLLNRCAGLLLGLPAHVLSNATLTEQEREFLHIQAIKALMAIGDWYLLNWQAYAASYAIRRRRFALLASAAGLPKHLQTLVDYAYALKLSPDPNAVQDVRAWTFEMLPLYKQTLKEALHSVTGGQASTISPSISDVIARWHDDVVGDLGADIAALRVAMVLILFALESPLIVDSRYLFQAYEWSARFLPVSRLIPYDQTDPFSVYAMLRDAAVEFWEAKCH